MQKLQVSDELLQCVAEDILSDVESNTHKINLDGDDTYHDIKGHLVSFLEELGFIVVKAEGK
jgi:hypothetical protein